MEYGEPAQERHERIQKRSLSSQTTLCGRRVVDLSAFQRQQLSVRGREKPLNVYVVKRAHSFGARPRHPILPERMPKDPNAWPTNWLARLTPNWTWYICSGHRGETFGVMILISEGEIDHRQTLEVMADL